MPGPSFGYRPRRPWLYLFKPIALALKRHIVVSDTFIAATRRHCRCRICFCVTKARALKRCLQSIGEDPTRDRQRAKHRVNEALTDRRKHPAIEKIGEDAARNIQFVGNLKNLLTSRLHDFMKP